MPCRAMRLDLRRMSSRPSSAMEPLRFASRPMMARMVVVFAGTIAAKQGHDLGRVSRRNVMPCRIWLSPYQTVHVAHHELRLKAWPVPMYASITCGFLETSA